MELDLACDDVYHDLKVTVSELYKRRRLDVNEGELRSFSFSNLEEKLDKNEPVDNDYIAYLNQLLGDLVEESEDDFKMETQNDTGSNDHDPRYRNFMSHESEDDIMMERQNDIGSDDHDPQYKIFLSNLKLHEKSYVLEVKGENGLQKFIEYEREDRTNDEHDLAIKRKMKNDTKGENARNGEHLGSVQGKYTAETPKVMLSVLEKDSRGLQIAKNKKSSFTRSVSLGKNNFLSQNLHSGKNCASQNQLKSDVKPGLGKGKKTKSQRISRDLKKREKISELDEGYQYFLDKFETETGLMISPLPNGDRFECEKDFGSRNYDSKGAGCKVERFKSISSGVLDANVEEEDSCQCLGSPIQGTNSPFRQKVTSILRKPYDDEEYKKLWHDVKVRKNITRHIDLRKGSEKSYSANKVGKSYLDYFEDLRQKIEAVQDDQRKKLNILRGFFFWLQNLTQEGVFRPWQDAACLAVMPGVHKKFNPRGS